MKKDALLTPDEEKLLNLYDAMNSNVDTFIQKIRVTQKKILEGKERLDKDGKPVLNEFGEILKWDDRFMITFVSLVTGGSHSVSVAQPLFAELETGETYIANGNVEYKTYKDDYNSTPIIVFNEFVNQRDFLIKSLANFKNSETSSK